ncbi:hypothetical protein [Pseudarthrobacter enclensis]|uniref:Vacuolar-type H+-ATPase subunit H n=1 Tax=Pseudarthrobacter enclensis TaxID=993070 RepID=A0ABT9RWE3_9MICC|nr:hypothetical protein [Pseudarthrobacter enclensis]MDP9889566.1 vacuolar-type H+-ATPase subunit H [Pseudarthrobacter enclensis]
MVRWTILDRFRPVGAPGPGGPAGVPAADDQGPAAELVPVFSALACDVAACESLVAEARLSSEREVARAREQAEAIVSKARRETVTERAKASARIEWEASERDAQLLEQARLEATALGQAGLARLPAAVDHVTNSLLASSPEQQ